MKILVHEIGVDGLILQNREHVRWFIRRLNDVADIVFGPEEEATVTELKLVPKEPPA